MSKTFTVKAESINILNIKTGQSEIIEKNSTRNVEDYDNNMLIVFSTNGMKNQKGEVVYASSIELDEKVELTPEGEKINVEAELAKQDAKGGKIKE